METQEKPDILWCQDWSKDDFNLELQTYEGIYNDDETFIKCDNELYEGLPSLILDVVENPRNYFISRYAAILRIENNPEVDGIKVIYKNWNEEAEEVLELDYEYVNVVRAVK